MKHHLPPLDGLKAFEAAARHLSFSIAADELCISKGAVSYQIRKLEAHLQCALFRRSVRQVYLTDCGQMLLQTTQQLFDDLGETLQRLQGDTEQSGVTVAVTTYVAARWLSAHISGFNGEHPQVTVLLQHSVNSADFKLTDVDLAIRWGPCLGRHDRSRFGEMPMPLYPVISPRLLEKNGISIEQPGSARLPAVQLAEGPLSLLPLLAEDRHQDLWQEWYDGAVTIELSNSTLHARPPASQPTLPTTLQPALPTAQQPALPPTGSKLPNPRRTISDSNVRVQAAIDGQGFILADQLMINELNSEQLVAPFAHTLNGYGYALLCSPNRFLNDHAQSLKNWLSAGSGACK